jgi:hypothetical protein
VDERLAMRLRLFETGGQAAPGVVAFVRAELAGLEAGEVAAGEPGLPVDEDSCGIFVSHLVMALTRALAGESVSDPEAAGRAAGELAEYPGAVRRAAALAERARSALGAELPETERAYLALHLAVLIRRGRRAKGSPA